MFANSIVSGVLSLEMRAIAHGGGGDHADHLEGGGRKSARERWVIVTRPEVGLQARAESSSLVCVAARDSELNPAVVADPLACRGRALLADPAQFARTSVSVILGEMDEDKCSRAPSSRRRCCMRRRAAAPSPKADPPKHPRRRIHSLEDI